MTNPALTRAAAAAALTLWLAAPARSAGIPVVAAERVYGAMVKDIAGSSAAVTSILNNPVQDPHFFEAEPSAARAIAGARLVILNGAGYDPWMDRLLAASPNAERIVLNVAALAAAQPGANPHLWYDPATMHRLADSVTHALSRLDPADQDDFTAAAARLQTRLAALDARVANLRARYAGQPVTATEPVFGPMAAAIGLTMRNAAYQLAAMNGTEPAARDVAAMEDDLRGRRVRVLLYNAQVTNASTSSLLTIAEEADVPAFGVTETLPPGQDYTAWMLEQLDCLQAALELSVP